jgi:hypothetical protein
MIEWNKYTWYSKLAAALFFIIVLPAWTFHIGTQYQEAKDIWQNTLIDSSTDVVNIQHTYKIPEIGMTLHYPMNWTPSSLNTSSYPTEVSFFEGSNPNQVSKWFEVHFSKDSDLNIKQYIATYFPPTEKDYSITTINSNLVLKHDSLVEGKFTEEGTPVDYTRVIDFAIEGKEGQFIVLNTRAKFPTKEEAQNADMSWADAIAASVRYVAK